MVTHRDHFQQLLRGARACNLITFSIRITERQVEAHCAGHIHLAWNSPLAWLQTERVASCPWAARGSRFMRDTDRDLTSLVVVRSDGDIYKPSGFETGSAWRWARMTRRKPR